MRQIYVEKRPGFDVEARNLKSDIEIFLGPQYPGLARLESLRILCRYEVTGDISEEQFRRAVSQVFSEPQCDRVFTGDEFPAGPQDSFFGVEYLPGQYDQRSDSAEQCLELVLGIRPHVRCAKFYIVRAARTIDTGALKAVQNYLVNPVDSRLVTDEIEYRRSSGLTQGVPAVTGFTGLDEKGLADLAASLGLAMSRADLVFCRNYFTEEKRDPTLTELRVLDTYWSDHCRHTTFTTILESIDAGNNPAVQKALDMYEAVRTEVYGDGTKRDRTLMDMAVIGAKVLKKRGLIPDLDESKEINACTVKVTASFSRPGGETVQIPYLLLFKNETHNHPTEIEPFGGAATCLGGAIRDPLSGRAYVYQAMRITGGSDPRKPLAKTLPGKLPQIKIVREAAAGYSSYGNQIGLTTGQVAEFYHPGYLAKRLELGAVIGAVPADQVRRSEPEPGDVVLLIGGKTGRDGIGGATGSSKVHTGESVESAGAEVQKGNAVEERKLQRLFRDPSVSVLIKRCNDFGAGGVAVAVGELAPGLDINLDAVPKKYAGLDGTELAISESQERMAVVVSPGDAGLVIQKAAGENLDAVIIAKITASEIAPNDTDGIGDNARLRMSWQGKTIVDIARRFLDANGAPRTARAVIVPVGGGAGNGSDSADAAGIGAAGGRTSPRAALDALKRELTSLRSGSRRGLQERFDGSIGASSVLFPWGGSVQGTPECGMAALLPSPLDGSGKPVTSETASLMSFGFVPSLTEADPYEGAKGAVKEALAKYTCLGGDPWKARLSLQEYFERMVNSESWGKTAAALLGALEAQLMLGVPAIGGKDSMSGSYQDPANGIDLAVPPTVVVFAAGTASAAQVRSGALSGRPGNPIILLYPEGNPAPAVPGGSIPFPNSGGDEWSRFKANMNGLAALARKNLVLAAYPVGAGGIAAALALMAFGNMTGVEVPFARSPAVDVLSLVNEQNYPGAVLAELDGEALRNAGWCYGAALNLSDVLEGAAWIEAAVTIADPVFRIIENRSGDEPETAEIPLEELRRAYESPLAQVYPQTSDGRTAAEPAPIQPAKTPPLWNTVPAAKAPVKSAKAGASHARPLVVLPVFPGTNCEWDMERAFREAGAETRLVIFRNRGAADIAASTEELAAAAGGAQIVAISGGFSAGDEPDGSGKFIANVFRAPAVAAAVNDLLDNRDGLMLGICNGFQALIKLGLVPYGRYTEAGELSSTLTFNRVGRHVSRMVRTRVMSTASPWLALEEPGTIHLLPVSHGEGRLVIGEAEARILFASGQVPFCYTDSDGSPALWEPDNPNGSDYAIEALTSPDGRILGKMGHSERCGPLVHINIPGNKIQRIFEAGVRYFS